MSMSADPTPFPCADAVICPYIHCAFTDRIQVYRCTWGSLEQTSLSVPVRPHPKCRTGERCSSLDSASAGAAPAWISQARRAGAVRPPRAAYNCPRRHANAGNTLEELVGWRPGARGCRALRRLGRPPAPPRPDRSRCAPLTALLPGRATTRISGLQTPGYLGYTNQELKNQHRIWGLRFLNSAPEGEFKIAFSQPPVTDLRTKTLAEARLKAYCSDIPAGQGGGERSGVGRTASSRSSYR